MSVEAKLSRLSLDLKNVGGSPTTTNNRSMPTTSAPPDSWEDDVEDDNQTPTEAPGPSLKPITSRDQAMPNPPPPTPISPRMNGRTDYEWTTTSPRRPSTPREVEGKRPEKTTATANRMIAGALGIKAPKKTEEQRQYDRAVKEAEIKKRNREKEEKERAKVEEEKVKAAVWDQ